MSSWDPNGLILQPGLLDNTNEINGLAERIAPECFCYTIDFIEQFRLGSRSPGCSIKRPDERMFNFYFMEKPGVNPHWHALIMLGGFDDETLARRREILTEQTEFIWKGLKPSGSVNIQQVYHQAGVSNYVAKELGYEVSYSCFITPNEF